MLHKLKHICIGDEIVYEREGTLVAQRVHGWRLANNGWEHHAVVGSSQYGREHEVSLSTIVERRRETLRGQETVTF